MRKVTRHPGERRVEGGNVGKQMQPIRDLDTVHDMTVTLSKLDTARGRRMFLLWIVGVNLGLRVSDLVDLKVKDMRGTEFSYIPKKQAHKKGVRKITIPIPAAVRKVVKARCEGMADEDWLFPSRKRTRGGNPAHITRQSARRDMAEIGRICGIRQEIGCHTMRKTFGYHYYQRTKDIALLQEWFYHSNPATTLIYIGVTLDNFRKMTDKSPFDDMDGVAL